MERYRMFKSRKTGGYFQYDKQTKRQTSLHTKDRESAVRMIHAADEKERTPMINRRIGLIYDPLRRLDVKRHSTHRLRTSS